jgi:hypothetical protein
VPQKWALQDSKSPVNLWSLHVIYGLPFLLARLYGLNRNVFLIYIIYISYWFDHLFVGGHFPRLYWLHKHVSRSVGILVVEFHLFFLSVEEVEEHSTMLFE